MLRLSRLKRKKLMKNLLLLFLTLILMIIFAEIFFRSYYAKTNKVLASSLEEHYTRALYREVSNTSNPNRFLLDPYFPYKYVINYSEPYGILPKPNCRLVRNGTLDLNTKDGSDKALVFFGETTTNNRNMRGLTDFDIEKNPENIRIALLGDSYTWGAETSLNFNYQSFLEKIISGSEILNFAIFGIGIDMMYLRWKYEALDYKPDVTVMAIYTEDVARAKPCLKKPRLEVEDGKIKISNMPPPSREEIAENYKIPKFESYFFKHLIFSLKYFKGITEAEYDYGFELLPAMLDEMKETSEKEYTFFMVAIINANGELSEEEFKQCNRLKRLLEDRGIPYIESFEVFKNEGYEPYDLRLYTQESSRHFSPLGNAFFAQAITDFLEEKNIIKKQKDYSFEHYYHKDIVLDITDTRFNTEIVLMKEKDNPEKVSAVLPFKIMDREEIDGFRDDC